MSNYTELQDVFAASEYASNNNDAAAVSAIYALLFELAGNDSSLSTEIVTADPHGQDAATTDGDYIYIRHESGAYTRSRFDGVSKNAIMRLFKRDKTRITKRRARRQAALPLYAPTADADYDERIVYYTAIQYFHAVDAQTLDLVLSTNLEASEIATQARIQLARYYADYQAEIAHQFAQESKPRGIRRLFAMFA